ncbi:hypothetical protein KKF84_01155 [Myxococcota bacterium]|nr:hypothetical protein [Myxococcota bacterium]MBU1533891.1 hypothetical protein [Myxococcota bacterium]
MIDFDAIVKAAQAMGSCVEDVEEKASSPTEAIIIPERFRTQAMANVLKGQGLHALAGSWNNALTVTTSRSDMPLPVVQVISLVHPSDAAGPPPSLSCAAQIDASSLTLDISWDFCDLLKLVSEQVSSPLTPGITVHSHLHDESAMKIHCAPLEPTGAIKISLPFHLIMLRPVLTLEIRRRRLEFLFGDRLFP